MKRILKFVSLTLSTLCLFACKPNHTAEKDDQGGKTITPDEDKTVNVYMPSPKGLQSKLAAEFKKETGIEVKVTSGVTGELIAKIEAEKNNPYADVLITASWSEGLTYKDKIGLAYTPEHAEDVYDFCKEDSHVLWGTSSSAVGIIYNTTKVQKEEIEKLDWADFGDKTKWDSTAHPFSIPDPTKSGAARDFVAGYYTMNGTNEENKKVMDSWVSNGIQNGGKNKPALAAVTKGTMHAVLAGVDYNVYSNVKKNGDPIAIYYPKSGTVINPRPAMIVKTAAHPNNAKLFMNFLLSDKGQELARDAYLLPGRKSVAALSDRTQVKDIPQLEGLDWNKMAQDGNNIAQSLVDDIKNRQ